MSSLSLRSCGHATKVSDVPGLVKSVLLVFIFLPQRGEGYPDDEDEDSSPDRVRLPRGRPGRRESQDVHEHVFYSLTSSW